MDENEPTEVMIGDGNTAIVRRRGSMYRASLRLSGQCARSVLGEYATEQDAINAAKTVAAHYSDRSVA